MRKCVSFVFFIEIAVVAFATCDVSSLEINPPSINFGKVDVGDTAREHFTITNTGSSAVTIDRIDSDNPVFFITSSVSRELNPGVSKRAEVAFRPTVTEFGQISATLSIISGGRTLATVPVSGNGIYGPPIIKLSTTRINFGSVDVGTFKTATFTITNNRGLSNLIVSFSHNPFVRITPNRLLITPAMCCNIATVTAKLIADHTGPLQQTFDVISNDPEKPRIPFILTASGGFGKFGFLNRTQRSGIGPNTNSTSTVQFVDFDKDGKLDLYLTGHDGNVMYKNAGNFHFSNVTQISNLGNKARDARGASWADVDNDGDLDVFIANFDAPSLILKNDNNVFSVVSNALGVRSSDTTAKTQSGVFLDFNNDGRVDVFVVKEGLPNQLFKNIGVFPFPNVASNAGLDFKGPGRGAVSADFNQDGFLDIYVVNFQHANRLYINNKNETFRDATGAAGVGFSGASRQANVTDFDADGDFDIFVVNNDGPCVLYRNQGNGKFQNATAFAGLTGPTHARSATFADFDRDGDEDLILAQSGAATLLYSNNGRGEFKVVPNVDLSVADNPSSITAGDADNDGDPDIVIGDSDKGRNRGDSIYQNSGGGRE